MMIDPKKMAKAFTPNIMTSALQSFDRTTMIVVLAAWGIVFLFLLLALYTVNLSAVAKRDVAAAAALEPDLPKQIIEPPVAEEIIALTDRLKKRFSDISFSLTASELTVQASDPSKFRVWLTVLGYVDTISPKYRWNIKELCVGIKCSGSVPMRAILTAEKITFADPEAQKP